MSEHEFVPQSQTFDQLRLNRFCGQLHAWLRDISENAQFGTEFMNTFESLLVRARCATLIPREHLQYFCAIALVCMLGFYDHICGNCGIGGLMVFLIWDSTSAAHCSGIVCSLKLLTCPPFQQHCSLRNHVGNTS